MSLHHDPSKGEKPHVIACAVFGGRSRKTGQRVGSRHRWSQGGGRGSCEFCGRSLDQVLSTPVKSNGGAK